MSRWWPKRDRALRRLPREPRSSRRLAGLGLAVVALAGCGGESAETTLVRCLARAGARLERSVGEQRFARFRDGTVVGIAFQSTEASATQWASIAAGPGDPFGYEAVGRAVVAWRGAADDPHLRAVERCLR